MRLLFSFQLGRQKQTHSEPDGQRGPNRWLALAVRRARMDQGAFDIEFLRFRLFQGDMHRRIAA